MVPGVLTGDNTGIEEVNITACYGGGLPCYNDLALTRQTTGVPAAGQGDSGGPVISSATDEGRYAFGVISGIRDYSKSCTGDADGRECSKYVLYAPISEFFNAGWGLNYYK
ncbi:hypothetical protein ACO03V_05865 [Microbacterium sp. HMH0099]